MLKIENLINFNHYVMSVIIWWLIFKDDLDKKYHTQPDPFQFLWNLASHSIFKGWETSLCSYTSVISSHFILDIKGTNKLVSLTLCMNSISFVTNKKQCVIHEGQLKIMQPKYFVLISDELTECARCPNLFTNIGWIF